jgi:hypothetical protein
MSVRDILRSCRCLIKSYQYIGYGKEKEIEFSIQASSRNFFNFLKISSMPLYNWDFSLVQIRNLLPRDALDAVVRIRADFDINSSNALKTIPEKEIEKIEREIAEITRNYYTIPQRPLVPVAAQPQESVATKEPRKELISWLSYVGTVGHENGVQFIYMKNTRDGRMLKFEINGNKDMSCTILASGNIEIIMDNKIFEIRR